MSKHSILRKLKRKSMREVGLTFSDRLTESIRTGKPMSEVTYKVVGKRIVAVKK